MTTANLECDFLSYDSILVGFSGGKDSIACVISLLEAGVPKEKIELWHHAVDGAEEQANQLKFDWPSTTAYCRAFAKHFGLTYYQSWKVGGFYREMMKSDAPTAPTKWEQPDGTIGQVGGKGEAGTRRMFPQLSANLSTRWCSAYLKVDVMKRAVANQARFNGKRILIVTGERAEESAARALYKTFEVHASLDNSKRTCHQARPIHSWTETQVWAALERWRINPAPAYRLGWGRLSCALCIFGGANQWASAQAIFPERVAQAAALEAEFGKTIARDGKTTVAMLAARGTAYSGTANATLVAEAQDENWNGPIQVENWTLPAGAFGKESCGAP